MGDEGSSHVREKSYKTLCPCLSAYHNPMYPFVPFELSLWVGNVVKNVEWPLQIKKRNWAKDKSRIFKRGWSPAKAKEQELSTGTNLQESASFVASVSFLTGRQRPGSKPSEGRLWD